MSLLRDGLSKRLTRMDDSSARDGRRGIRNYTLLLRGSRGIGYWYGHVQTVSSGVLGDVKSLRLELSRQCASLL